MVTSWPVYSRTTFTLPPLVISHYLATTPKCIHMQTLYSFMCSICCVPTAFEFTKLIIARRIIRHMESRLPVHLIWPQLKWKLKFRSTIFPTSLLVASVTVMLQKKLTDPQHSSLQMQRRLLRWLLLEHIFFIPHMKRGHIEGCFIKL